MFSGDFSEPTSRSTDVTCSDYSTQELQTAQAEFKKELQQKYGAEYDEPTSSGSTYAGQNPVVSRLMKTRRVAGKSYRNFFV